MDRPSGMDQQADDRRPPYESIRQEMRSIGRAGIFYVHQPRIAELQDYRIKTMGILSRIKKLFNPGEAPKGKPVVNRPAPSGGRTADGTSPSRGGGWCSRSCSC